jgi:Arc/MetJ-type ribon-helix-helix transcriptional regulator
MKGDMPMAIRTARVTVRLSREEVAKIEHIAKERGYLSPSAFVRTALRNELTGRESELTEAEQRIAATLERLTRDVFRIHRGQQALFAVVDTFVKTFLTCIPEPPRDGMSQSVARARDRYDRFVKSAGQAMVGDSQAALNDLVNRAE